MSFASANEYCSGVGVQMAFSHLRCCVMPPSVFFRIRFLSAVLLHLYPSLCSFCSAGFAFELFCHLPRHTISLWSTAPGHWPPQCSSRDSLICCLLHIAKICSIGCRVCFAPWCKGHWLISHLLGTPASASFQPTTSLWMTRCIHRAPRPAMASSLDSRDFAIAGILELNSPGPSWLCRWSRQFFVLNFTVMLLRCVRCASAICTHSRSSRSSSASSAVSLVSVNCPFMECQKSRLSHGSDAWHYCYMH